MISILKILQIASALVLVLVILVQNRGSGLSATFGGEGGFYATKRGAEKILATTTIVVVVAFLILSFIVSVIHS
ncbi:MAG: hypothetical protein UT55_C0015G0004 [Candidatus Peregrinibacteria bacterium GW2011_GWE2_39_6]|nr:MAG: hypothetical protein UT36_C0010G0048 [Candidatus Peregrinibacteria bacterium GW2011_GWF2_39_17]KKR26174.1 MAG: hypothetical protein UT55_C0015G0004 [Candidatus Peregrinibacteria bacterium GW2011_GWE2_39_6]HCW32294.1 preprotein translocase subunit SecG [Candidatus Peregrinibacteria bacterium]